MMKWHLSILACWLVFLFSCREESTIKTVTTEIDAPFGKVEVIAPDFSQMPSWSIVDFGANESDKNATSKAIAAAISKASSDGGGIIEVPKGVWPTGKIHLKSNINLHVQKGAVLLFSDDPQDYLPAVHTTWEGLECFNYSPLIFAQECTNVAITGEGELRAEMGLWEMWFARPAAHMNSLKNLYHMAAKNVPVEERQVVNDSSNLRPHFIQFNRCKQVLLEGVQITNSPFWVIHPYLSEHVTIRNVKVKAHGHNNDGVDPEMSTNVLIENCVFDQGDDAIAIKSGRNQDAWRLNTPSKNIILKNCKIKKGHQLVAIGSELSGGVENVWVDNCEVTNEANLFHLVFIKTNERRGGFVKNICVSNVKSGKCRNGILGIETDVLYQWRHLVPTYEVRLTQIEGIYLSNISATEADFVSRILGNANMPVKDVSLTNVTVQNVSGEAHLHKNATNFVIN